MMSGDELRRFATRIFQCFLDSAVDTQFVILENGGAADEFVQFKLNHRILYGEVGSREWAASDERRPLDAEASDSLAGLGFTHGGPERNYICDELAMNAPYLADLYLRLHLSAYGALPADLSVKSDVTAVRMLAGARASKPKATGYRWDARRHEYLRTTPISASAGLKFRVERALRSNFAEIGTTTEELEALRRDVEGAETWEAVPAWAQDWIRKAEEGPLWAVLRR